MMKDETGLRHSSFVFRGVLCCVGLVVFACLDTTVGDAAAAGVEEARAAFALFQNETNAAWVSQSTGDLEAAKSHQTKARAALAESRNLFDEAGAATSTDPALVRDYAEVLLRLDDADLATKVLKRVTEHTPNDPAAWRELGKALSALGRSQGKEAIHALRRSLELDSTTPGAALTLVALGVAYRQQGLYDLAVESFSKALGVDSACVSAKIAVIGSEIESGQVLKASDDIDALGAINADDAALLEKSLAESMERFDTTRSTFPDSGENHSAYAKLLFRSGRFTDSLNAAERSAKLAPDVYATQNFIGDLSRQFGNTARAREAYARSLQLQPDQPKTAESLKTLDQAPPAEEKK